MILKYSDEYVEEFHQKFAIYVKVEILVLKNSITEIYKKCMDLATD